MPPEVDYRRLLKANEWSNKPHSRQAMHALTDDSILVRTLAACPYCSALAPADFWRDKRGSLHVAGSGELI